MHESGYAEAYVPFCGHAVLESLSGVRTDVEDPELAMFQAWQPAARVVDFQKRMIDEMAEAM